MVDPLQLIVRQYQAVHLLVALGTRHHDSAHQHWVTLLLLSGLEDTKQQQQQVRQVRLCRLVCDVGQRITFTKCVEGKVAKSEETLAPGCWWTTCSATSSCTRRSESLEGKVSESGACAWFASSFLTLSLLRVSPRDRSLAVCSNS